MPTKPTSRPKGRPRYIVRNWSAYDVMDQVDGRIDRFLADGALDGQPTYDLLIGRRQELPIPEVIVHHAP